METYQKYTIESMALSKENSKVSSENNVENEKESRKIANEWKEKGNEFVKLKDYESAS